jgi:hypothetical protein
VDDEVTANDATQQSAGGLVSDLLAAARRAIGSVRRQKRYYIFVTDDNGKELVFLIWATSLAEAERTARSGALPMHMTVTEVRAAVRQRQRVPDGG